MEIQSANFSFLREHDPQLVNLAARAEQFFLDDDSNTCIIKLRQFAERLAKLIAANTGLSQVPKEAQLELIQRLRREGIISSEVDDLFHSIRKAGNDIVHENRNADSHEALTLLKDARYLGIWFHRTFSRDKDFRAKPFVRPVAPTDPTDEIERLKADADRVRLENEQKEIALRSAEAKARQAEAEKQRLEKILRDQRGEIDPSPREEKASTPSPSPKEKKALSPSSSPKRGEKRKREGWHHGVIGIVASRLVERYGAPVFIGSYEDAHEDHPDQVDTVRFSVRGIPEFHVFQAIEYEPVKSIRLKGGGHKAAGGFTMPAANLEKLRQGLREFADRENILPSHISPLINVDVRVDLSDISMTLLQECDRLQPCGLGNADPVFYSENVRVISQQARGKDKVKHLALELDTGNGKIKAIAWRWGEYCPVPNYIDIAYKLRANQWQDTTSVELEVVGIREAKGMDNSQNSPKPLQLQYKPAPVITKFPQWQKLSEAPRPLPRPLLLYGYERPAEKFKGEVDCDRPRKEQNYAAIVFWTLPPSFTHLQWLIAMTKPDHIYVSDHVPPIPSIENLRQQILSLDLKNPPLNLLELSQQWWISPSAIVAGLRELGYSCQFPNTLSLEAELLKMQKWNDIDINKLANIIECS
ncbi:MAG: hypothetical protein DCE90_05580 [Pseudanabaena sp.]|nr:MAG: hypothetical protein DCE90_05580 [Pseudanabaena sp.]